MVFFINYMSLLSEMRRPQDARPPPTDPHPPHLPSPYGQSPRGPLHTCFNSPRAPHTCLDCGRGLWTSEVRGGLG